MSTPSELRALSDGDLAKRMEDTYKELLNLRFRLETRQLENSSELRKVRRTVAQLKTIARERELQAKA